MNTSAVPLQVGSENTNMSNYSVTFHFLISYAQLYNDKSINCAAIYGKNNTDSKDFSALFYFTDNKTKNESNETLLPGIDTTS